jgi:hypothetical protein
MPLGRLRRVLGNQESSAKLKHNAFCLVWKDSTPPIVTIRLIISLGASPQTPWVGFAEFWVTKELESTKQNNALLLLLEKKKNIDQLSISIPLHVVCLEVGAHLRTTIYTSLPCGCKLISARKSASTKFGEADPGMSIPQ